MEIELDFLHIVVGTLIPLAVGAITKADASSKLKAWVNAGLSALAAAIMVVIGECASDTCLVAWQPFASTLFVTYLTNIGVYYGLLKPTQTSVKVQEKTRNIGITDHAKAA